MDRPVKMVEMDEKGLRWMKKAYDPFFWSYNVCLVGLDDPIGVTFNHPIWSLDRGGWAGAGDLHPGEHVATENGYAVVQSVVDEPGEHRVYNIEVETDNRYLVSNLAVLVHNVSPFPSKAVAAEAAKRLGFETRVKDPPFNSHGQPVFKSGNKYVTPDVDGHNGGVWKMFDGRGNRLGTYDANMNLIGD